jgi:hypothetical protein
VFGSERDFTYLRNARLLTLLSLLGVDAALSLPPSRQSSHRFFFLTRTLRCQRLRILRHLLLVQLHQFRTFVLVGNVFQFRLPTLLFLAQRGVVEQLNLSE